jgi:hypothetical protein
MIFQVIDVNDHHGNVLNRVLAIVLENGTSDSVVVSIANRHG